MVSEQTKDRFVDVVAVVELTLILTGLMYYYVFKLPRQQAQCVKQEVQLQHI